MANRRVCLIVDNPARDLDGMTLVAKELAEFGYEVFLVPFYQSYEVYFINPDMVVVNYIRPNNFDFVSICRKMGISISVLDTEGAIVQDIDAHFKNIARSIKDNIDLYFVWGPAQAEALQKTGVLASDRTKVTGSPRYDLCHPSLRHCLNKIALDEFEKIILVNTNHPILFPRFQSAEKEKWNLVHLVGWQPEFVDEWMVQSKVAAESTIETTLLLAQHFPIICFVLRPHPFEDSSIYADKFSSAKNVRVIQEGNVFEWIHSSEVLVHRNCSTAIEAVLMGKEALNMKWPTLPHIVQPVPEKISISVYSLDKMKEFLTEVLQGSKLPIENEVLKNRDELIARFFYKSDGKNSQRVAYEIDFYLKEQPERDKRSNLLAVLINLFKSNQRKEIVRIILISILGYRGFVKLKAVFKKNRYDFSKEFSAKHVDRFLNRLAGESQNAFKADYSRAVNFCSYSVCVKK